MKTGILTHLCLIALLLGSAHAEQARYHVSASGDDMNPGTEVDPSERSRRRWTWPNPAI